MLNHFISNKNYYIDTLLFVVGGFISAVVLMLLWNIVFPEIFNISKIKYWQAYSLQIIAGCILYFPIIHIGINLKIIHEKTEDNIADISWMRNSIENIE